MKEAILCIDDEPIILETLEMQLTRHFGETYELYFVESADEALECLEELKDRNINPRVIISDWLLPGIKGDELLIEAHRQFPEAIKLMLTGQADYAMIERARLGANLYACIRKPWRADRLKDIIEEAIAGNAHLAAMPIE